MKKADALQHMTLSLVEGDTKTAIRLMIETRGINNAHYCQCQRRASRIKHLIGQGVPPMAALMQTREVN